MKAKNLHTDTENEREVIFHDSDCQIAILRPSDGCHEIWEACDAYDPRRGVMIYERCFRFVKSAYSFTPEAV